MKALSAALVCALVAGAILIGALVRPASHPGHGPLPMVQRSLVQWPLAFEKNRGQFDPRVRFAARPRGAAVALSSEGVTVSGRDAGIRLGVVGASAVEPEGDKLLAGKAHYL